MPKFRVEITGTKIMEVDLCDDDLGPTDESLEDVAVELAEADAFSGATDFRVKVIEDWDLTIEEVRRAT